MPDFRREGVKIWAEVFPPYWLEFELDTTDRNKRTCIVCLLEFTKDGAQPLSPAVISDRYKLHSLFSNRNDFGKLVLGHQIFRGNVSHDQLRNRLSQIITKVSHEWWGEGEEKSQDVKQERIATTEPVWDAEISPKLPTCGFTYDSTIGKWILTEACWLPTYITDDEDNIESDEAGNPLIDWRPWIIVHDGEKVDIVRYAKGKTGGYIFKKMAFPSMESHLLSKKATHELFRVEKFKEWLRTQLRDIDNNIEIIINRHSWIYDNAFKIFLKRWIEGTYFYDVFDAFPILNVFGSSETGKTRIGNICVAVCYHPMMELDITNAGIFRTKEEEKPTQIIDETEKLQDPRESTVKVFMSNARTLLNASYSKYGGTVSRYDEVDGKRVRRRFNIYSPTAVIGISGLEGVLESRSLPLNMRRVKPYRDFPKATPTQYTSLTDKLYQSRILFAHEVREMFEDIMLPEKVAGRQEELWRPIFVMTRLFGTPAEEELLAKAAVDWATTWTIKARNIPVVEILLNALDKLLNEKRDAYNRYRVSDLADEMSLVEGKEWTPKRAGNALSRVGIWRRKKIKGKTVFFCGFALLQDLKERYGLLEDIEAEVAPQIAKQVDLDTIDRDAEKIDN